LTLNLHQLSIMGFSEMKYGYARVSSKGQDYTAQVEALKAAGCERIFSEKASAKNTDGRPEFLKLLKVLLPGDTVVVTQLDRLARSSRDLLNIVHELEGLSCAFVSLGESWCDTTTDAGRPDVDHHGRHCRRRTRRRSGSTHRVASWRSSTAILVTRRRGRDHRHRRTAIIPLYDDLRVVLANIPKRSTTLLTNVRRPSKLRSNESVKQAWGVERPRAE
jgi:hypothetical protein